MKIGFVSLGCCKNLVDSEQIMGMIKRGGHEIVANPKDAQAIIVNTCGFIEKIRAMINHGSYARLHGLKLSRLFGPSLRCKYNNNIQ